MKKSVVIYVHGQGGSAAEAEHYKAIFPQSRVIGLDYISQTPWEAKAELPALFDDARNGGEAVTLIANSIGAFFSMYALADKAIDEAFFISPIVDMKRLIADMMKWANVTEAELREKGTVETSFGQTLSWDYLTYVREHPIRWTVPTHILFAGKDSFTSIGTISDFAAEIGADLTVMENGEHWFHTDEQMQFLDRWIESRKQ